MLRCCAAVPQIAVGYNHSIAVANDGGVWTWGNGGYGRLGHKVQQVRHGERVLVCHRYRALSASILHATKPSLAPGSPPLHTGTVPPTLTPQDELKPRLVEVLTGRVVVPPDARVAAGQTSSFCTIVGGQIFAWGKLKPSGVWCGVRGGGVAGCAAEGRVGWAGRSGDY